jgi:signal transduction histidine kinase
MNEPKNRPSDSEIRRRLQQGKEARDDAELLRRRFAFLDEASDVLASSLDYEATLASVARLVVPRMADWCSVYVDEEEGGLRQLAVAHIDPAKVEMARELGRCYPPDPDAPRGVPRVLRTGRSELTSQITDEMLVRGARDEAHLKILRELGLCSAIVVPLIARGRAVGVLTFATAESGHSYGAEDLALAEELAHRAALAVDNARLYREARESARRREELIEQLSLLVEASGSLTQQLELPAVLAAILDLAGRLIAADAHAVWRCMPDGTWQIVEASGLSEEYLRLAGHISGSNTRALESPVVAEDVQALPMLEIRQAAYRREGIASLLAAPLRIRGEPSGTLVFYYRRRRRLDEVTVRLALALANLAASAIGTAELYQQAQEELRQRTQAEQALREADRLKDEFLAMLAHELRNPLAPIRSSLHIIAQPGVNEGILAQVREMMERQVRHMARLLDDLLDVSRITRGKIELRREVVEVGELVGRSLEAVRPVQEERRHEMHLSLPSGPLHVWGDPTRLEQVLVNLLGNACKYTEPGGRIELVVERDGDGVVVQVGDNGIGIAADVLPIIFDLFVQANRRLDRSQGGVGIGLTLVRKLVELHGGTVEVASPRLGQGSTFTVRLPALVSPGPEQDQPQEQKAPARGSGPGRGACW